MKRSELRQLIKEEISRLFENDNQFRVGDKIITKNVYPYGGKKRAVGNIKKIIKNKAPFGGSDADTYIADLRSDKFYPDSGPLHANSLEKVNEDDSSNLRKKKAQLRDNIFKLNAKIYDLKARDQENVTNGRPKQYDHFVAKLRDQADSYREQLKNLPKYSDL